MSPGMNEPRTSAAAPEILVLPKRVRAPDVPPLYREVQKRAKEGPLILDFSQVDDFDGSTLALIHLVGRQFPSVETVNMRGALDRARESFIQRPRPAPPGPASRRGFFGRFFRASADAFLIRLRAAGRFLAMFGDEVYHLGVYIRERKGVYPGETWNQLFFMGYRSFPIVCLLIFLVGVTISITSAEQLRIFGADVYIADLVGLAMLKELVPLMTGIILAGKVGAAITAELSSMVVLEEVDAMRTMGIVPEKYLMVPRLLAITMAVPLLVAMADVVGILGGVLVARITFGMPPSTFLNQMMNSVVWSDFVWGLVKTIVFGWAVVVGSGYKGLTVGRSAEEVGRATTESVVLSITLIVLIDCLFAFILY